MFKKDDSTWVENYNPVTLLSLVYKVLGRCIPTKKLYFLQAIISDEQHGFMPNRSCVTTFRFCSKSWLCLWQECDVVYLDFSTAFDSVNHPKLIEKLRYAGIVGSYLRTFLSLYAPSVCIIDVYWAWFITLAKRRKICIFVFFLIIIIIIIIIKHISDLFCNAGQKFWIYLLRVSLLLLKEACYHNHPSKSCLYEGPL